jgi:hypothetical protein
MIILLVGKIATAKWPKWIVTLARNATPKMIAQIATFKEMAIAFESTVVGFASPTLWKQGLTPINVQPVTNPLAFALIAIWGRTDEA